MRVARWRGRRYMDKRLAIKLNGNRTVNGTLRGFDQFMNIVLDETEEEVRDAPDQEMRSPSHVEAG
jgi:small nuclear ribonucleoprotein (snRNP)-like protein